MQTPAPIAIFLYNRPAHTQKLFDSLATNNIIELSEVYVFCDGPKSQASTDELERIKQVHNISSAFKKAKTIEVFKSDKNMGLANSVIHGINHVLAIHPTVIVLEDDLFLSPLFLEFLNQGLLQYEQNTRVMSVSGYMYPLDKEIEENFFMRFDSSWGWATWKRAWNFFEHDENKLIQKIESKQLIKEFNFDNSYDFFGMLLAQQNRKVDSWSIRWYASIFLNEGLTLYPKTSLVLNTGHDGSGVHSSITKKFDSKTLAQKDVLHFPGIVEENKIARHNMAIYFKKLETPTLIEKIKARLLILYKQIFASS